MCLSTLVRATRIYLQEVFHILVRVCRIQDDVPCKCLSPPLVGELPPGSWTVYVSAVNVLPIGAGTDLGSFATTPRSNGIPVGKEIVPLLSVGPEAATDVSGPTPSAHWARNGMTFHGPEAGAR